MKTPLAIYVHWPYCSRICPYCDFNVYKGAQNAALVEAIILDLAHWRNWSGPREINSIHFGGGTPSLLTDTDIGKIIETVSKLWDLPESAEIGIEANPIDCNEARWHNYRRAGVNRVSLGVQSFEDEALKFLGRQHSGRQAQRAVECAKIIFPNISIDLIYGLSGIETENDLWIAGSLAPHHISTYQLTIEEGTAFHRAESRGQMKAVDNDESAERFDALKQHLLRRGYERYEISNWAKPGFESKHNRAYWRGLDYVGVGPGAHGRLTQGAERWATITHKRPDAYIKSVTESGLGLEQKNNLTNDDRAAEYVMMGLRITEDISAAKFKAVAGENLPADRLSTLIENKLLTRVNDRITATEKGRDVLDYITGQLLI